MMTDTIDYCLFKIWDAACDAVVERGNWLKFGQNDELAEILLSTGDKEIIEASPSDKIVSKVCSRRVVTDLRSSR